MMDGAEPIVGGEVDVFISYAHADEAEDGTARALADMLEVEGYSVWWDRSLVASQDWLRELSTKARLAKKVVALVSPRWLASRYCHAEMFVAYEIPGKLVPYRIVDCALPSEISHIQFVDHNDPFAKAKLIAALDLAPSRTPRVRMGVSSRLSEDDVFLEGLPTGTTNFVGRDVELSMLHKAWGSTGDHKTNAVVLYAIGGAGKSAILREFLDQLEEKGWAGAQKVYGWSAYSQGSGDNKRTADADGFINSALKFFGHDIAKHPITDPVERGRKLASLVRRQRTILVLDGLEPLQDLPEVNLGRLKDKGLQALVTSLAKDNPGLLVITSRQELPELAAIDPPRVLNHALDQLDAREGATLLTRLGVHGRATELEKAVKEVGGHALSVSLLGTYLSAVCAGDVAKRDTLRLLEIIDDAAETLGDRRAKRAARIMDAYVERFEALQSSDAKGEGDPERMILSLVGLFDRPAEADAIAAVMAVPPIPGLTNGWHALSGPQQAMRWSYALKRLRALKLISAADPAKPDDLDAHPVVRQHFGRRLKEGQTEAYQEANRRLYTHYCALPEKLYGKELPDTLDEMAPLFAAIAHGCAAGLHQEVFDEVYYARVLRGGEAFINNQLGANSADLGALAHFFEPPWSRPHPSLTPADQAVALNFAGFALRALGRLREAVVPIAAAEEVYKIGYPPQEVAVAASNLSELLLTLGDVADAVAAGREAVTYADRSGDTFQRLSKRATLSDALHQAGQRAEAERLFREAERLQADDEPDLPRLYSLAGYKFCDLLLTLGRHREVAERAAYALEIARHDTKRLLDISLDTLSLGRAAHMAWREAGFPSPRLRGEGQGEGRPRVAASQQVSAPHPNPLPMASAGPWGEGANAHLTDTGRHVDAAVEGLRKAGTENHLPRGLLARAAFRRDAAAAGVPGITFADADTDLGEVHEIATRGGMRLHLTDYHLERVRLLLAQLPQPTVTRGWFTTRTKPPTYTAADRDLLRTANTAWTAAHTLVQKTGYHRRDPDLADLRTAIDTATKASG